MRPVPYPARHTVLPPRLCGGTPLYAAAWLGGSYSVDWDQPYNKRDKGAHRLTIADTRGRLDLTVPVAKPATHRCLWSQVAVSGHGAWWDVHRVALESAYGRTPYFEFYIDRFQPMLTAGVTDRYPLLHTLAAAWERHIAGILGLRLLGAPPAEATVAVPAPDSPPVPPYRQVRDARLGFIDGLSVLDLIFNLGPEAQLYLHRISRP